MSSRRSSRTPTPSKKYADYTVEIEEEDLESPKKRKRNESGLESAPKKARKDDVYEPEAESTTPAQPSRPSTLQHAQPSPMMSAAAQAQLSAQYAAQRAQGLPPGYPPQQVRTGGEGLYTQGVQPGQFHPSMQPYMPNMVPYASMQGQFMAGSAPQMGAPTPPVYQQGAMTPQMAMQQQQRPQAAMPAPGNVFPQMPQMQSQPPRAAPPMQMPQPGYPPVLPGQQYPPQMHMMMHAHQGVPQAQRPPSEGTVASQVPPTQPTSDRPPPVEQQEVNEEANEEVNEEAAKGGQAPSGSSAVKEQAEGSEALAEEAPAANEQGGAEEEQAGKGEHNGSPEEEEEKDGEREMGTDRIEEGKATERSSAATATGEAQMEQDDLHQLLAAGKISLDEYMTLRINRVAPELKEPPKKKKRFPNAEDREYLAHILHSFGATRNPSHEILVVVDDFLAHLIAFKLSVLNPMKQEAENKEKVNAAVYDAQESEDESEKLEEESEKDEKGAFKAGKRRALTHNVLAEALFQKGDKFSVALIAYFLALKASHEKSSKMQAENAKSFVDEEAKFFDSLNDPLGGLLGDFADVFGDKEANEGEENVPFYQNEKYFKWKPKFLQGVNLESQFQEIDALRRQRDEQRDFLSAKLNRDEYLDFQKCCQTSIHKRMGRGRNAFRNWLKVKCGAKGLALSQLATDALGYIALYHVNRLVNLTLQLQNQSSVPAELSLEKLKDAVGLIEGELNLS